MNAINKDNLTIKAAGDWELDVLGVPFGSPTDLDSDKQYFSPKTNLYLREGEETNVFYYHGYTPDGKEQPAPVLIGRAKYTRTDAAGHWWRVVLDKSIEYAARVWGAAKDGIARASSGAVAHLVRVAANGEILSWPFAELSVFDTGERRQPANPNAMVTVAKAQFNPTVDKQPEATGTGEQRPGAADNKPNLLVGAKNMDETEVKNAIEAALKADREARAAEAKAEADKQAAIEAAVKAEREKWEAEAAKSRRLPQKAPYVTQYNEVSKFDNYPSEDLDLAASILKSRDKSISPALRNALALKSSKLDASKEHGRYVQSSMKATGMHLDEIEKAVKDATDPMYSTLTSYGDEWIGAGYSNALWEAIRANNRVVAKIPSITIPDGWESMTFPVESADPTWYVVAQATTDESNTKKPTVTVTNSLVGSAKAAMTLNKMGARTMYSGELTEDSLVPYAAQLRMQFEKSGQEAMENIVINGDVSTSSNINDIGGTTYSGTATTLFLFCEGFRFYPTVTGVATHGRSAAGGFVIEDFIQTAKLLGSNGLGAADLTKINFIVDANTWYAAMNLPEVKTRDVNSAATVENGFLTRAYGVEIIPSWQMFAMSTARKANTAGKVDNDTTTNNAYGGILGVRWDQWKMGYKRRMTMETTRFADADAWELVALSRWGMTKRAAGASAITYYVGV